MKPENIIEKYYIRGSRSYEILMRHSVDVAAKALAIADRHPEMNLDRDFIYEAAMLHDIGIFLTDAPDIDCFGKYPYICHGYLGSELLTKEGLPQHALVCERHTGVGLSLNDIIDNRLPLPHRDMLPVSLEEKLICLADKFYSKSHLEREKSIDKIRKSILKHGSEQEKRLDELIGLFIESQ